jgi:putative transposase
MVGPSGRRRAVSYLISISKYSERRACRLLGQWRSTQRYRVQPESDRDRRLRRRVVELARQHPRYGYRRLTSELRRGAWKVNRKHVRRICREEGLKIARRSKKRRRLGHGNHGVMKLRAERKNHVWSYDFVFDQLENGRAVKILPIVDNFTRECLHIEVAHNITGDRVVQILNGLLARHGVPSFIRSDNGPEFIARAVRDWLAGQHIETAFIEPGSPWENAYSESFNSRFRDELLDCEIFTSLLEARTLIEQHRRDYNQRRPHSSLGYKTPREFVRENQAMEAVGMWKAAEKHAFPQALENAPHPPPAFPSAPTASATETKGAGAR